MVHVVWESDLQNGRMATVKRHRHTPEQAIRKLREGERLLTEGRDLIEVLRLLEITDSTWHRWRKTCGGMKAEMACRQRRPRWAANISDRDGQPAPGARPRHATATLDP